MNWKILALTLLLTPAAWADRVFIEPVKGAGVAESDRESVGELIRIAVTEYSRHTVTGNAEEADISLAPALMKLGDSYVLSLQKKNKSGQAVYGEKMKAAKLAEIDTVAARLTRAVLDGASAETTQDVTNVTEQEQTNINRRLTATRQWIVGFGPGWTSNLASQGGGFTFALGFLFGVDPDFSINLSMNTNSGRDGDDSSFTDFSLGGEYYFTRNKHSPFVGARLGCATARVDGDGCNALSIGCSQDRASGWSGTVTAGWKFFRTSNVNMAIIGTHTRLFDRTSLGDPSLTSAQIAVYF